MRCKKCGKKVNKGDSFCINCGSRLPKQSPGKKKFLYIAISLILVAIVIAAGIAINSKGSKDQYNNYIKEADKYVDEMNYEKAEALYSKAIQVEPKKADAYLKLADVYLADGKQEEVKEIIKKAKKCVSEIDEQYKKLEQKQQDVKPVADTKWTVKPKIDAGSIFYIRTEEGGLNRSYKQGMDAFAVIEKDGQYGIINMDGEYVVPIGDCKNAEYYGRYYVTTYSTKYFSDVDDDWNFFMIDEQGNLECSMLGDAGDSGLYYYCNGLRDVFNSSEELDEAIPVQRSEKVLNSLDDVIDLESNYSIYSGGKLITDFIYEKCGSASDGLLAVCRNGKWGYVDETGKEVISCEYDPSWKHFLEDSVTDASWEKCTSEFCYAFSDGYVPLCKDNKWELRNTEGNLIIPAGVYQEICPVYKGKCWVKQNGKWGMIEIKNTESHNTVSKEKSESELKSLLENQIDGTLIHFFYDDFDGDGIREAYGVTGDGDTSSYSNVKIYFISSEGQCKLIKDDYSNQGFYGHLTMDKLLTVGNHRYVLWELDAMGSASLTFVFGVKDGQAYEPDISGKLMAFATPALHMGIIDSVPEGQYVGYKNDFSKGYHDYIPHYYKFNEKTLEFYEVE